VPKGLLTGDGDSDSFSLSLSGSLWSCFSPFWLGRSTFSFALILFFTHSLNRRRGWGLSSRRRDQLLSKGPLACHCRLFCHLCDALSLCLPRFLCARSLFSSLWARFGNSRPSLSGSHYSCYAPSPQKFPDWFDIRDIVLSSLAHLLVNSCYFPLLLTYPSFRKNFQYFLMVCRLGACTPVGTKNPNKKSYDLSQLQLEHRKPIVPWSSPRF